MRTFDQEPIVENESKVIAIDRLQAIQLLIGHGLILGNQVDECEKVLEILRDKAGFLESTESWQGLDHGRSQIF